MVNTCNKNSSTRLIPTKKTMPRFVRKKIFQIIYCVIIVVICPIWDIGQKLKYT